MNLHSIKAKLLTWFGDIKVYKYPMFIVYCPTSFLVSGAKTREAMEVIEDGDIILRGYSDYLDGKFIPGTYSHTGLYVGNGKMIHATAEGVNETDIIDFLRCDRFCIMRPSKLQDVAIDRARELLKRGIPYDFDFKPWNNAMYCHEMVAQCYYELHLPKKIPTLFKGLIKGQPSFLADSFLTSPEFKTVLEFKP